MTIDDLKFNPNIHIVGGKLRPPDKCEQRFIVNFSNRLAKNKIISWTDARTAVYLLYQQWWFGWRAMTGKLGKMVAEMNLFDQYWRDNMPEGYGRGYGGK